MTASRLYPERPFLAASVCVVRDGKVLLAARARPPMQGVFTLPGGLVEPGETLAEAAIRELREEVGVEAEILGFVGPVEVIERDAAGRARRHFVICAHAARWLSGDGQAGEEALEVRWLGPDELGSVPTTAGLPGIVAGAVALASQHQSS
ncbi:NUDIX domain-containing protein [Enterovirga aerilata]|uniref:NUDIX hydrolase n=1 Tax=Enterovirga aerilata TaxID=2730920 RepID=A0A849IC40_9HYPH|nr:NUDIX hydrolase [Enterovirga sp. DB1703]